jgi:hypothetical protein
VAARAAAAAGARAAAPPAAALGLVWNLTCFSLKIFVSFCSWFWFGVIRFTFCNLGYRYIFILASRCFCDRRFQEVFPATNSTNILKTEMRNSSVFLLM